LARQQRSTVSNILLSQRKILVVSTHLRTVYKSMKWITIEEKSALDTMRNQFVYKTHQLKYSKTFFSANTAKPRLELLYALMDLS
jgi:hypothetical protein